MDRDLKAHLIRKRRRPQGRNRAGVFAGLFAGVATGSVAVFFTGVVLAIGLVIGELVYQPLQCLCFVGRGIAWGVFGAFLGIAEGIIRRSWRGLRSATIGGLIGGVLGEGAAISNAMIPFLLAAIMVSWFGLQRRKWQQGENND